VVNAYTLTFGGLLLLGAGSENPDSQSPAEPGPVTKRIPAGAGPAFASQLPARLHRAVDHAFVAGYVAAFG
jgi:hypothetical protein